jgi:hypothetical protein
MFKFLKRTPVYFVELYMKSGNVVMIDNVLSYSFENSGNEITGVSIQQRQRGRRLLVKTIDMTQIECVVVGKA